MMKTLSASQIAQELNISRSYLYKIIKEKSINVEKTKDGHFQWDNSIFEQLKLNLKNNEERTVNYIDGLLKEKGLSQVKINNRRYLGNKFSLGHFIRSVIDNNCQQINIVADIFGGTGAVSDLFKDKMLITNDLLFSNYICHYAWFFSEEYDVEKIIFYIDKFNQIKTDENNYMRENFSDTFFSADVCSKIGFIREEIEALKEKNIINKKEYAILITSLLYGMDKIANTVGHYDAYRKTKEFKKELILPVILPEKNLNKNNQCYNKNANDLIREIECDLLYLDPPYNSRQYSDAYHLLENVAKWDKPKVFGIARKMDRSLLKSDYCLNNATQAFEDLIHKAKAKYILLSYNNMANKGNSRSNAKIEDEEIIRILSKKGEVSIFEQEYKTFSTGKSNIENNSERLFLCKVYPETKSKLEIASPLNYIGGKFKLLNQIIPLFPESSHFLDVFAGGCNVGINVSSSKITFNDNNKLLVELLEHIKLTETEVLLKNIENIIEKYRLSRTDLYGYAYYHSDSSKGLAQYNKTGFLQLRNAFNQQIRLRKVDFNLLYVLIVYSFNNQIRFNKNNEFNLPVGKRDFNAKMRNKLRLFSEAIKHKDVNFSSLDFRTINLEELEKDTFIYCDPPYLITTAGYNENGAWTEQDENDLLDFLIKANQLEFKFALSNVLLAKGKENKILKIWVEKNGFTIHFLDKNYANSNYQRKEKDSLSQEVLITNY